MATREEGGIGISESAARHRLALHQERVMELADPTTAGRFSDHKRKKREEAREELENRVIPKLSRILEEYAQK
jgi:hypothetical protein